MSADAKLVIDLYKTLTLRMPWQGYFTSLFGNVLLLGCFVDKQEGGATAVQAIGATANFIMLGQAGAELHQQISSNDCT